MIKGATNFVVLTVWTFCHTDVLLANCNLHYRDYQLVRKESFLFYFFVGRPDFSFVHRFPDSLNPRKR